MGLQLSYPIKAKEIRIDEQKCEGEGLCVKICSRGCFVVEGSVAKVTDKDLCLVCHACEVVCPEGAIEVVEEVLGTDVEAAEVSA